MAGRARIHSGWSERPHARDRPAHGSSALGENGMTGQGAIADPAARMSERVGAFYEAHPYPPAVDDLAAYGERWDDARRRADSHLFWPHEPYRDDRSILVAGCGTTQAAHYAMRW